LPINRRLHGRHRQLRRRTGSRLPRLRLRLRLRLLRWRGNNNVVRGWVRLTLVRIALRRLLLRRLLLICRLLRRRLLLRYRNGPNKNECASKNRPMHGSPSGGHNTTYFIRHRRGQTVALALRHGDRVRFPEAQAQEQVNWPIFRLSRLHAPAKCRLLLGALCSTNQER
jgi:hypothetical protein